MIQVDVGRSQQAGGGLQLGRLGRLRQKDRLSNSEDRRGKQIWGWTRKRQAVWAKWGDPHVDPVAGDYGLAEAETADWNEEQE